MAKLLRQDLQDIIGHLQVDQRTMTEVAEQYGVKRQGLWKYLKRNGVSIKRTVDCVCNHCGVSFQINRKAGRPGRYCSKACYYASLSNGNGKPYIQSRTGQRQARRVVEKHFELLSGNIVHHEDRNNNNNDLKNLMVFANQGDHVRYHRCGNVQPLWKGLGV